MFWLLPRVRVRPSCIPTACKYPTLRGSSGRDLLARYSTPPPGSIRRSPTFGTVSGILTVILGGTAGYLLASQFSSAGNSLPNVRRTGSYGSEADMQSAILELEAALPGQVSTNPGVLQHHAFSPNTYHHGSAHRVVVSIAETPDVVTVVNISRRWRIPITPYSGGTSLEGNFEGVRFRLPFKVEVVAPQTLSSRLVAYAWTCHL
jgi:D-lactate dehydrogenase (cytochrome)